MSKIKIVSYDIFYNYLQEEWKEIFTDEYKTYGSDLRLFGFYNEEEFLGGFCLGFNPDFFEDKEEEKLINNLLKNNYNKISYYYIVDKYKGNKIGAKYLFDFMEKNNDKYFLTCNGDKLKEYYISLGFLVINNNKYKHILSLSM